MAISDNFSGTLAKWADAIGTGYSITDGKCDTADNASGGYGCQLYVDETAGTIGNNWAKTLLTNLITNDYYGVMLRGSELLLPDGYGVFITPGASAATTVITTLTAGVYQSDPYSSTDLTWSNDDTLGASINGVDPDIVIDIWQNPVGSDPVAWLADKPADISHTIATGHRHDAGNYIGLIEWSAAGQASIYDDFAGGDSSSLFQQTAQIDVTITVDGDFPGAAAFVYPITGSINTVLGVNSWQTGREVQTGAINVIMGVNGTQSGAEATISAYKLQDIIFAGPRRFG